MDVQNKIFDLEGKVQPYQWGGFTYIPTLLSREVIPGQPSAEYWLGAHTAAPSIVNGNRPLNELISEHPEWLGAKVQSAFGRLPYLLKVLDVKDMLSIQVHPSRESAKKGFALENEAGIPLNAPHRNYKDDNHKPELAYALSDMWLLHGFRSAASLKEVLQERPELQFLLPVFGEDNYAALYRFVMEMPQEEVNRHLQPLIDRISPLYLDSKLDKTNPDFWAARAAITYNTADRIDRGIFSVYFLNVVRLEKGKAIFQDAGLLHAYLEGQNVEIMANSDNVLRGGLTPKYVDVPELMKHVHFVETIPQPLDGTSLQPGEQAFITPAEDFELHKLTLAAGQSLKIQSPTVEILLVIEGEISVSEINAPGAVPLTLKKGQSLLLTSGAAIEIKSVENSLAFRATVPGADQ